MDAEFTKNDLNKNTDLALNRNGLQQLGKIIPKIGYKNITCN